MTNEFLIAILAGLGGMFGWGLADFFAKKTIDEVGDTASLAWGHIFGTVALFLFVLYQIGTGTTSVLIPQTAGVWGGLVFFGVLQAAVYLLLYRGFGQGSVSILSPVFASYAGLAALLSILFFGETVGPYMLLALVVLFVGVVIINTDLQALRNRELSLGGIPGMRVIAGATALAAVWTIFWDQFVGGQDWLWYTFYMYAIMTVVIIAFAFATKVPMEVRNNSLWKFLALIGVTEVVAYAAISWGFSLTTHTSLVALLSGAFSLPVIVLARIFLGERMNKAQTLGAIIVIIGIMMVSIF